MKRPAESHSGLSVKWNNNPKPKCRPPRNITKTISLLSSLTSQPLTPWHLVDEPWLWLIWSLYLRLYSCLPDSHTPFPCPLPFALSWTTLQHCGSLLTSPSLPCISFPSWTSTSPAYEPRYSLRWIVLAPIIKQTYCWEQDCIIFLPT